MGMSQDLMNQLIAEGQAANEKKGGSKPKEKGIWKPSNGQNIIRVVTNLQEMEVFRVQYKIHFNIGPGNNAAPCPKSVNLGNPCPICARVSELYNGTEEDQKKAKDMKAKDRYKSLVIDINNPQEGVQVYEYGPIVYGFFTELLRTYGDFTDINTGRNIALTKNGEGLNTKYFAAALDATQLDPAFVQALPSLIQSVEFVSNQDLMDMLSGAYNINNGSEGVFPQGAIPTVNTTVHQPATLQAPTGQQVTQPVAQGYVQPAPGNTAINQAPAAVQTQMQNFNQQPVQQQITQAPAAVQAQTQQPVQQQVTQQVNSMPQVQQQPVTVNPQAVAQQNVQTTAPAASMPAVQNNTGQNTAAVMPSTTEEILARMNAVANGGNNFVQ